MTKIESEPNLGNQRLDPNETGTVVDVPVMITHKMERQLSDLGLSEEQINRLTPEGAWDIINGKKPEEQSSEAGAEEEVELTPAERIKNIEDGIQAHQQEITNLAETIEKTRGELNRARKELGLPPTEEEPPSVSSEKEKLEKLKAEQEMLEKQKKELESEDEKNDKKKESKERGEGLKENDLIIADVYIESAKNVLRKNRIPYKEREYKKRQVVDVKTDSAFPGEFVFSIFDPKHPDKPASFNFVSRVFDLLKSSNVAVRYGKNPERG